MKPSKILTIVFTKSKKRFAIFSILIRWYMRTEYSHVARNYSLYNNEIELYYQASEGRVNYEISSVFNTKHEIIKTYNIEVGSGILRQINKECFLDAGKPYGIMQNVGIVLVRIAKLFKKQIKNPFKSGRNCSELIYLTVFDNIIDNLNMDADLVSPKDIETIILKYFKLHEDGIYRLI